MKKLFAILFVVITTMAFVVQTTTNYSTAIVSEEQGIYIFMLCKPVTAYEYMGTIEKKGIVMTGKPEEMLNIMLKKARKEYPRCNAIIFTKIDMYKADCIKFKE